MIIGDEIGKILKELTIDFLDDGKSYTRDVQYGYGDHQELVKWIYNREGLAPKYPLIWYPVNPYIKHNEWMYVDARIIFLQDSVHYWDNTKRLTRRYTNIIEPLCELFIEKLEGAYNVEILGEYNEKYEIKDEPNYGVENKGLRTNEDTFLESTFRGSESIVPDVVDGRVLGFKMRIKKNNCI